MIYIKSYLKLKSIYVIESTLFHFDKQNKTKNEYISKRISNRLIEARLYLWAHTNSALTHRSLIRGARVHALHATAVHAPARTRATARCKCIIWYVT